MAYGRNSESKSIFAVQCQKGWRKLYQPLLDLCVLYGAEVVQVKEKFGILCFYFHQPLDDRPRLDALVYAACAASAHTCEDCGQDGSDRYDPLTGNAIWKATRERGDGWIRTLCEPCRKAWRKRRNAETTALRDAYEARKAERALKGNTNE